MKVGILCGRVKDGKRTVRGFMKMGILYLGDI